MTPGPRRRGFTLLEFLVALVLAAGVMVILTEGSRSIFQSWLRSGSFSERQQAVWSASQLMRRQLTSTLAFRPGGGPRSRRALGFDAKAQSLSFVTTQSMGSRGRMGLWMVNYALEELPGGEGMAIVAREWPAFLPGLWQGQVPDTEPVVLLTGISEAVFSYRKDTRRQILYREDWPEARVGLLPGAVRLSMMLFGEETVWEFPLPCSDY